MSDPESDLDPTLVPPSLDDIELHEDLQAAYENLSSFYDLNVPPIHSIRIVQKDQVDGPPVIRIIVNGKNLNSHLERFLLTSIEGGIRVQEPENADAIWDSTYRELIADPEYPVVKENMYWFFVRYFPKLFISLYDILLLMSSTAAVRHVVDEQDRIKSEARSKEVLAEAIRNLQKDIYKMLKTRTVGRPEKIHEEPIPNIVRNVLDVAKKIMGEKRGKDSAPGLKTIAYELGLSEDALGAQLRRASFPWTTVKKYLEDPTRI